MSQAVDVHQQSPVCSCIIHTEGRPPHYTVQISSSSIVPKYAHNTEKKLMRYPKVYFTQEGVLLHAQQQETAGQSLVFLVLYSEGTVTGRGASVVCVGALCICV